MHNRDGGAREHRTIVSAVRPTREPNAPFIAGPPAPPVANAPRVITVSRGTVPRELGPRELGPREGPREEPKASPLLHELLVSLPRERLPALCAAVESRGGSLVLLAENQPAAWKVGFDRPAFVGCVFATLGAIAGALLGKGETALPVVGWLPASVVCAAAFAGGLGAFAFALAFVLDSIARPTRKGARVFCLVRGGVSAGEATAHGGEIVERLPHRA